METRGLRAAGWDAPRQVPSEMAGAPSVGHEAKRRSAVLRLCLFLEWLAGLSEGLWGQDFPHRVSSIPAMLSGPELKAASLENVPIVSARATRAS